MNICIALNFSFNITKKQPLNAVVQECYVQLSLQKYQIRIPPNAFILLFQSKYNTIVELSDKRLSMKINQNVFKAVHEFIALSE